MTVVQIAISVKLIKFSFWQFALNNSQVCIQPDKGICYIGIRDEFVHWDIHEVDHFR